MDCITQYAQMYRNYFDIDLENKLRKRTNHCEVIGLDNAMTTSSGAYNLCKQKTYSQDWFEIGSEIGYRFWGSGLKGIEQ